MLVDARVVGRPEAGLQPRELDIGSASGIPLRALIDKIVRQEVVAFADRERARRFARVLTRAEIDRGVTAGKIDAGDRPAGAVVDAEAAVREALTAFGDGLYFVFVDEAQVESLDDRVDVGPDTRVRFLRLVALAGG